VLSRVAAVGIAVIAVAGLVAWSGALERDPTDLATEISVESDAQRMRPAVVAQEPGTTLLTGRAPGSAPPGTVPASTTSTDGTSTSGSTTTTRSGGGRPATGGGPAPAVSRVDTTRRVIFLGIDDGMVRSPAVLDYLERERMPFSVFPTTGYVRADLPYWRRAVAIGGTIQAHTHEHSDLTTVGTAKLRDELCGPLDEFERLFGTRPTLVRPPYGNHNEAVRRVAGECGYRAVVLWRGSTNNGILTMQDGKLHPGDIILLHFRDTLLDDLRDVARRAREEGFTIAKLEDYL
jgi:peptidoglycan/xylan/chitin deacetylase (PgdA/CDA1 family)